MYQKCLLEIDAKKSMGGSVPEGLNGDPQHSILRKKSEPRPSGSVHEASKLHGSIYKQKLHRNSHGIVGPHPTRRLGLGPTIDHTTAIPEAP